MNAIFRWVILSIALHGVALLIIADYVVSTVIGSPQAPLAVLEAKLQHKSKYSSDKHPVTVSEVKSNHLVSKVVAPEGKRTAHTLKTNMQVIPESPTGASMIETTLAAVGETQAGDQQIKPPENISQDGMREYRLSLSREARRSKRYPAIARQRGLEGIVVVVVSSSARRPAPQVSLGRSSGQVVLDQQAMEMLGLAVRAANMPESLNGKEFAIELPIHFSLED